MTYTITTTATLDLEFFADVIDTAGDSIGYWASELMKDETTKSFLIKFDGSDFDDDSPLATGQFLGTYQQITDAIQSIISGNSGCGNWIVEQARDALNGEPTMDADLADVIIQLAVFGEIVYG
jgi:hypothetical protein